MIKQDFENRVSGNNEVKDRGQEIRTKLLDAGEKLFAEKGFAGTSVRLITKEAKCNIAAVNYHFDGKENLYVEVFRRHMRTMRDVRVEGIRKLMSQKPFDATLEDLLSAFADAFVEPLVGVESGQRFMKLMVREMLDRHLPEGMFFEETIMPVMKVMLEAVQRVCPGIDRQKAMLSIRSVVAQLVHRIFSKEMLTGIEGADGMMLDLASDIEHIVAFSAAGFRGYTEGGK